MCGKKQVYGDFEYIPIKCHCPCNEEINLNKKQYMRYEKYGYPKYKIGHWTNSKEGKSIITIGNKLRIGLSPWNKGLTKETDERINKYSKKRVGMKFTEEHKKHLSENHWNTSKENNPNWQGGLSFGKYCPKFDQLKREEIRNRYGRKCIVCGKLEEQNITKSGKPWKLHIHHIDYDKEQGCNGKTFELVPLCLSCHSDTTNGDREEWKNKILNILNQRGK